MAERAHRYAAVVLLALAGACTSPCEQRRSWHAQASRACQMCLQTACATEAMALVAAPPDCLPQLACAGRCPDLSSETCGCVDACLTTPACSAPFDAYTRCAVAHCDTPCR